jgi:hypothetical protein
MKQNRYAAIALDSDGDKLIDDGDLYIHTTGGLKRAFHSAVDEAFKACRKNTGQVPGTVMVWRVPSRAEGEN